MKKIEATKRLEPPSGSSEAARKLVLYVEDEADNREVTELRLRDRFELVWAETDREAVAMVAKTRDRLYAILMDIQLKGSQLDGIQLTALFQGKATFPLPSFARAVPALDIPIIFVTAYGARYSEEQLLAVGGTHVIRKPVDFMELTLALGSAHTRSVLTKLERASRPRPAR